MNIRVTGQTQTNNAIGYLRQQQATLARLNDQVSSGLKLQTPSDDPANYAALVLAKASGLRFDTYTQTMADATAALSDGADSLGEANDVLVRAKEIGLEAVNDTTDATGYEALATEMDGLIGRMMTAGNKQVEGKYVFGGTATDTPPFVAAGTTATGGPTAVVYKGATDRGRVLIGPGQTMDTRYVGSEVFQQAGGDAFQSLIDLRDTLRNNSLSPAAKSAALTQNLASVESARTAVSDTTAEQSSNLATLETLKNRVTDLKLATTERATALEGTDYSEAVVKIQEQQGALQATLAVTSKLMQRSLLDFIQ